MRDINGAKAGSSQKKPYRAPVSATSVQTMRVKYGISEGTIRGFGKNATYDDMLKRIYLDGTPIMSAEGEKLLDVVVEFRDGSQDQDPIDGLPSIAIEHDVGVEVKLAAPVSRSFTRDDTNSYDVRISVPSLYEGDSDGNSRQGTIIFRIDVSTDSGAFVSAGEFTIKEKILNGYSNTYNIEVPKGSNHVVRVVRLNSEVVNDYSVNKLIVESIVENTDVRLRYSNTAILYLEYDAEQFSNVPKLEMRIFGKNDILVPANYNEATRTYATSGAGTTNGVWNGTWKRDYTDNPVWIALDLILASRYGLGDKIDLSNINKWELYSIAQYCDELVDDGKGGREPRFTCNNAYLQKAEDAYRVLKDLTASFRAKVVWDGEYLTFSADTPRDPVFVFTNANTRDITYSSTQDAAQRNLINVQFYDKENKFASDVVMQRSRSNILSRGKVVDGNFTALGCTSRGQAQRSASYVLNTEIYETEIVSFTTGLEGGLVRLNDVFMLADYSVAGRTLGGRIAAVAGNTVTLDREIPAEVTVTSETKLVVNQTSSEMTPISVVSISADRLTVTLETAPPAGTEAGLVWALLTRDLVPQQFYVTDIAFDAAEMTYAISGLQYNASKYAAIDGSARIVTPPISVVEYGMLKAPLAVIASYNVNIVQDISVCDIDVSWSQSSNAVQYQLEMQKEGTEWKIIGRFASLSTTLENMYTGSYTFRVCAYDSLGNASQYTYSDPLLVAGKVLPPPKLTEYTVKGILFGYQHDWVYPAHTEDSRAVRLRYTTLDPVANNTQDFMYLDVAYPTTKFVEQDVSIGLVTWFSAAIVDKYGNVGEWTAWQSATPTVDADEVLTLLDGQITSGQLDQDLRTDIAAGVTAGQIADDAKALATEAKTAANSAVSTSAAAQTAANAAQTASNAANTAASNAATAASSAQSAASAAQTAANTAKTTADQAKADVAALTTSTLQAQASLQQQLDTTADGLTQEITDRQAGDDAVVGQLNTYKTSNDAAVAAVQQQASSAVTSSNATATALTNLTATVNTKNRTYQQTTAPTANLVTGDLWINTTAGKNNEMKRWSGTAWTVTVDPRIASTATALATLTTDVATINGKTTTNSSDIVSLRNDLTTTNNTVSQKADSSALTALNSTVTQQGNAITSQGTRVTNLENSINHATTGLATKASTSALNTLDSKVTSIDGRIDTTNSNVTTLTGRVDIVEGTVATKADAAALTALTTRVGNAEGVNTSQGTAITTLQNTVNHATTGLATKASTTALNTLDSKVTTVDGRVTTNASNITTLQGKVTTVENGLATKADSSALNSYYTKTQTDAKATEIAAGEVSKYDASLVIGGDNLAKNSDKPVWGTHGGSVLTQVDGVANTTLKTKKAIRVSSTGGSATIKAARTISALELSAQVVMSARIQNIGTTPITVRCNGIENHKKDPVSFTLNSGEFRFVEWVGVTRSNYDFIQVIVESTDVNHSISFEASELKVEYGTKATAWTPSSLDVQSALGTNATAISDTIAEVSRVDGRVTTEANRITALTGRVDTVEGAVTTKADATALTNLTTRVTNAENVNTSQGTAITTLNNTVNHATTGLATKASSAALNSLDSKVTAIDGRVTSNSSSVTSLNNSLATTNTNVTAAQTAATNAMTAAGQKGKVIFGTTVPATADRLSQNLWIDTTGNANTPKRWNGSAWVAVTDKVATDALAAANSASNLAATKADSSALTALDSKVTTVDGKVATNASNITTLQGKVTTVENGLATKADGSALSALTTRVSNAEGELSSQSSKVTKLEAGVGNTSTYVVSTSRNGGYRTGGLPWGLYNSTLTRLAAFIRGFNLIVWAADGSYSSVQRFDTYSSADNVASLATALLSLPVNTYFTLVGVDNVGTTAALQGNAELKNFVIANGGSATYYSTWGGNNLPIFTSMVGTGTGTGIQHSFNSNITNDWIKYPISLISGIPEGFAGVQPIDESKFATAAATDALTLRVTTAEGNISSQGTRVTNLENSVNNATTGLTSKASASALTTLNNQVQHSTTGLSAVNTKVDNLKATIENTTSGLTSKASSSAVDTLSNKVNHSTTGLDAIASKTTVLEATLSSFKAAGRNYLLDSKAAGTKSINPEINTVIAPSTPIRMGFDIEIRTPVQAGARNRIGFECSYTIGGTTYYCGLWLTNASSMGAGKRRVYVTHVIPSSWTAGSSVFPSTFSYYNQTSGGDFTVSNIKLEVGDAYTDWTPAPEDNASASAVDSLTARVTTAEGKITTEATKLGTLTTTVGNHTSSISSQQTSINGLSAKATLQVVANNTIGGVALGNNAGVVDFIVRANTFAIAPPVAAGAGNAGKYAFTYQSTSVTLPNGTVVPAGLYLDNAAIGQINASKINADSLSAISANLGTIKVDTAHIDNLAVTSAKIANLAVTTGKIADLAVDTLKIAYGSVTSGTLIKSAWNDTVSFAVTAANTKRVMSWVQMYGSYTGYALTVSAYCEIWLMRDTVELEYRKFPTTQVRDTFGDVQYILVIDAQFMHLDVPTNSGNANYWVKMRTYATSQDQHNAMKQNMKCDWMLLEAKR